MNGCICVLCSNCNDINKKILEKLYKETNNTNIDLYLLFDETNHKITEFDEFKKYNSYIFTYNDLIRKYDLLRSPRFNTVGYVGNTPYPFIDFASSHGYDYYMFYEDDMLYTGNIVELFNDLIKSNHNVYYPETPINDDLNIWFWSRKGYNRHPEYVNNYDLIHHVLNMYIIDKYTANTLNIELKTKRWFGHHEWVIPTMIKFKELSVKIFNEKLKKCYQYTKEEHILKRIKDEDNDIIFENSLYHPVKSISLLNRILSKSN